MGNTFNSFGIIAMVLIIFVGCDENNSAPQYDVSGTVSHLGQPAPGISVSIDNYTGLTVMTDDQGHFDILNLNAGQHRLKIFKMFPTLNKSFLDPDGSSFSERTYDIDLTDDMVMNNLQLPKPVVLENPQTDSSVVITWSSSDVEDFREYKLYRHTSSGLDETTGELIHVSTSRVDTSISESTLDLAPDTYFYRIYVMNDYGKLGGSNIVELTVAETILKITLNYTGQYSVSAQHPAYIGVSQNPCYHECQDEGSVWQNNGSIEIDVPEWFSQGSIQSIYGPYYISSFVDITGSHQGAHVLPDGCPFIVYHGIDPVAASEQCYASPIYIPRGTTLEVIVEYDDSFITDNYNP